MATKKVKQMGKVGARVGRGLRRKILGFEQEQRKKHKCPSCMKPTVKRLAAGIWQCSNNKCGIKFAGKAYVPGVKA